MKDTIKGFLLLATYPTYRWIKTNLRQLLLFALWMFFFGLSLHDWVK